MSIDVVALRGFRPDENALDMAFPVYAIECEVHPPYESQLDAYEEAALKLVSVGLAANGISKTLNITLSLAEQIISRLEGKELIERISQQQRGLTEGGKKYLIGTREIRPSENSRFGYMFVSAIKKDILQYFFEGSIGKIARSDAGVVQNKLLLGTEDNTFSPMETPKRWRLEQAYKRYLRNLKLAKKREKNELTLQEAKDIYENYESDLDEADYSQSSDNVNAENTNKKTLDGFVRPLKGRLEKLYIQMRIIISPEEPGGFTVESPLALNGIDNEFFLRQVQWMKNPEQAVFLAEEKLDSFLDREILKLSVHKPIAEKDKSIFILEKLPQLAVEKERYLQIYSDVGDIYELMGNNISQISRENIVGTFHRKLLEYLLNRLIRTQSPTTLRFVKETALDEIRLNGIEIMAERITKYAGISRDSILSIKVIKSAIIDLDWTHGDSVSKKLINILVIFYYATSQQIMRFVQQPDLNDYVKIAIRLNRIRNPVSHATNVTMSIEDYNYYITHVFDVANRILESLKEVK